MEGTNLFEEKPHLQPTPSSYALEIARNFIQTAWKVSLQVWYVGYTPRTDLG